MPKNTFYLKHIRLIKPGPLVGADARDEDAFTPAVESLVSNTNPQDDEDGDIILNREIVLDSNSTRLSNFPSIQSWDRVWNSEEYTTRIESPLRFPSFTMDYSLFFTQKEFDYSNYDITNLTLLIKTENYIDYGYTKPNTGNFNAILYKRVLVNDGDDLHYDVVPLTKTEVSNLAGLVFVPTGVSYNVSKPATTYPATYPLYVLYNKNYDNQDNLESLNLILFPMYEFDVKHYSFNGLPPYTGPVCNIGYINNGMSVGNYSWGTSYGGYVEIRCRKYPGTIIVGSYSSSPYYDLEG